MAGAGGGGRRRHRRDDDDGASLPPRAVLEYNHSIAPDSGVVGCQTTCLLAVLLHSAGSVTCGSLAR